MTQINNVMRTATVIAVNKNLYKNVYYLSAG